MPYPRAVFVKSCWQHAKHHKIWIALNVLTILYGFIQGVAPLVDWSALNCLAFKLPKIPLPWFLVILLCLFVWTLIEGGYRYTVSLQSKVGQPDGEDTTGPNIFVDCPEKVRDRKTDLPLILTNSSDEPACNVAIEPIKNGGLIATFKPVTKVVKESSVNCEATVENERGGMPWGPIFRHDLRRLLAAGPEPQNLTDVSATNTVEVSVLYSDITGKRRYKSSFSINYKKYWEEVQIIPKGRRRL